MLGSAPPGLEGSGVLTSCKRVQAPVDILSPVTCKSLYLSIKIKLLQHSGKAAAWQSRGLALRRRQQQQPLLSPISHQRPHSLGLPLLGFLHLLSVASLGPGHARKQQLAFPVCVRMSWMCCE